MIIIMFWMTTRIQHQHPALLFWLILSSLLIVRSSTALRPALLLLVQRPPVPLLRRQQPSSSPSCRRSPPRRAVPPSMALLSATTTANANEDDEEDDDDDDAAMASITTSASRTTTPQPVFDFDVAFPSLVLDNDVDDDDADGADHDTRSSSTISLELRRHKPMGCTVEESLAISSTNSGGTTILFVSAIVPGGNADQAGLRVGDVVVGITGLFGLLESTDGMDLSTLRILVTNRAENDPLALQVLRGTSALADHERALTDLCANPDADYDRIEQCIAAFLQDGYDDDNSVGSIDNTTTSTSATATADIKVSDGSRTKVGTDDDDDDITTKTADDMIDSLYSIWATELPESSSSDATTTSDSSTDEGRPKVKPWSVRSSPSGTYVRDPATGEMRNITQ